MFRISVIFAHLLLVASVAYAADVVGQVSHVQGDSVDITLRSGATLDRGERVEIFVELPGLGEAQVATATVASVASSTARGALPRTTATARVQQATGKVQAGQKVRSLSIGMSARPDAKPQRESESFASLFNGADLSGWILYSGEIQSWGVEGGSLVTSGSPPGWLYSERQYSDFELSFEYKIAKDGDSGIGIRTPWLDAARQPPVYPLQIQIVDDESSRPDIANVGWQTGGIWMMAAPSTRRTRSAGQWNSMTIIAYQRQMAVSINETLVVNVKLDDYTDWADRIPGVTQERGHICLQSFRGRTEFRNLLIKPLSAAPSLAPPETVPPLRVDRIEIVSKGIYRAEFKATGATSVTGRWGVFQGVQLVEDTSTIPARSGIVFGFEFIVNGEPDGRYVPVKIVAIYPEGVARNPQTGQPVKEAVFYDTLRMNRPSGRYRTMGSLGNVPCAETYQIWYQGRKYAEQKFTLVTP